MGKRTYDGGSGRLRIAGGIFGKGEYLASSSLAGWRIEVMGLFLTALSLLLIVGCSDGGGSVGDSSIETRIVGKLNTASQVSDKAVKCDGNSDCDGDTITDEVDIDDDGDGLIEIGTAEELDAVRHQLDGAGFRKFAEAGLDQTGCGNGASVRECFGYELVGDISVTDYIAINYAEGGWRPIGSAGSVCDGGGFTGMFEGNGFVVRGLFINRTGRDCIGLFGQSNGTIRHLGVVADRIIGRNDVGTLVGYGRDAKVVGSYVVVGEVDGANRVGVLLGDGSGASIVRSYGVGGMVGGANRVGILVGNGRDVELIHSYGVSGSVRGDTYVGGLVGQGSRAVLIQSYGVVGEVGGVDRIGGLLGNGKDAELIDSYGVSGIVRGGTRVGGLVGFGGSAQASYWDSETSGRMNDASSGSQAQDSMALRSPIGYTGIYSSWDAGAIREDETIAGVDHNGSMWCDEDFSGVIEAGEKRAASHTMGDNRIWDFGRSDDYPAIRCTAGGLVNQRAWWYLDSVTAGPHLNQTYLTQWLEGLRPLASDGKGDGGSTVGDGGVGDNGAGTIASPVRWSVIPVTEGFSIHWHNLGNFSRADELQHLSFTLFHEANQSLIKATYIAEIVDFIDGIYHLTDLVDGVAYRFPSMITLVYGDNTSVPRLIDWLWEVNELDNDASGIVVGTNYDGDGRADSADTDDDNDGVADERNGTALDSCPRGALDWVSDRDNDYDGDGCRNDEDSDGDNDGIANGYEASGCELVSDCDGDGEMDGMDIDADGDGLIEIGTAVELDAVRYVLNGTGYKANETAILDQTGCGGRGNISECFGYELVRNISLTDYIAEAYPVLGWEPIASDWGYWYLGCRGDKFTAIFDGNGFVVSGLFIDRSDENCIGLFGRVDGTIRNLGVVADRIIGRSHIGTLVGYGLSAKIIRSYGVAGEVRGYDKIGGLVGLASRAEIVQSHAVSGVVRGRHNRVGGLVGGGNYGKIIQSYAVSGEVRGNDRVGGLVGNSEHTEAIQSYAVSSVVSGNNYVGGLLGHGPSADIVHSYAVSGAVRGRENTVGLVGAGWGANAVRSYWDSETSGIDRGGISDSQAHTSMALRSPTGYEDIYSTWDDGAIDEGDMVAGVDHNGSIWCDEDSSGVIEAAEMRDSNHVMGDNRVWDFGTSHDYPAIRCTADSLAAQRAWWYLHNTTHKPQLNIAAFPIHISERLDEDGDRIADVSDNCPLVANSDQLDTDSDGLGDVCDGDKDGDGVPNEEEMAGCELASDCDNDGYSDAVDAFPTDPTEWLDSDGDRVGDTSDTCPFGQMGWHSNGTNDVDGDGCRNDEDEDGDNDGVANGYEASGCELAADCDGDGEMDGMDIDDDGDGLIEIGTAAELDAVRYVLDGSGYKVNGTAILDQTGCGGRGNISGCSGYELVRNISLTDYIAEVYPVLGWLPIAHAGDFVHSGDISEFTGIFDGNSFVISGLLINRTHQNSIGLFRQVDGGVIRHLGIVADRVIGGDIVGILAGNGAYSKIVHFYGVSDEVRGDNRVGGLIGHGSHSEIVDSYVVSGEVSGKGRYIGGLVGHGWRAKIDRSYVVSGAVRGGDDVGGLVGFGRDVKVAYSYGVVGEVRGGNDVGGLVGYGRYADIIQSYGVIGAVSGDSRVGGLVGNGWNADIIQSYGVIGAVSGHDRVGGLAGLGWNANIVHSYVVSGSVSGGDDVGGLVGVRGSVQASYWDSETSGRDSDASSGSQAQTSMALRSPIGYEDIYSTWDDGAIDEGDMVAGVDHNGSIWCDEDSSGVIEAAEMRDSNHVMGDNRIWDFGSANDYPAIRCTADSLAAQRAWWYLHNTTHKPQLNIAAFPIHISERLDEDGDRIADVSDNCPLVANSDQLDTDSDGLGDLCDDDKDGDGIANEEEVTGCELASDCDNDGYGDAVDIFPLDISEWLDSDGDEIGDNGDNCPLIANSDQLDTDNDGAGDVCDGDKDGDGIANEEEVAGCELVSDCDGDGEMDGMDIDADGDGLIEIGTAAELDAVRYVLNGTGYKANGTAMLDQTGCGDGAGVRSCSGYELVRNISLTDYIAEAYPVLGWEPIASDWGYRYLGCRGDKFTAIFDGNGFVVSGLFIDRSDENCIGLFGRVDGTIRNLGVVADRIIGRSHVGTLVGYGIDARIIRSYGVVGEVRGYDKIGGLVGLASRAEIVQSHAVSGVVRGRHNKVGGLVGGGNYGKIIQSYAVSGEVRGNDRVGGLVGNGEHAEIIQSYAVSSVVSGNNYVGGLLGHGPSADIVHSYVVSGAVRGRENTVGLVGAGWGANAVRSYWDSETSGIDRGGISGSQAHTGMALRSPTGYSGIYSTWDDGAIDEGETIADVDHNGSIWCDEDSSGVIEAAEMRDSNHVMGDNRVWDFGSTNDYPAIRCTVDSLANQRAWWYLNRTTHKPQLNQTRLDTWLEGLLP